jgi:acyl-CoA reductase-like NAD-dependent aldehyde dehydrogenase
MGRAVGARVAARVGRTLLELGGNNAVIVAPSADLDLAVRAILFSAVGTAGKRCTTLRRLIVHESISDVLLARLKRAYARIAIGDARVLADEFPDAWYASPAIVKMSAQTATVRPETFTPILYALKYASLDEVIALHNDVPQGLTSCIFTTDVREAETFLSAGGGQRLRHRQRQYRALGRRDRRRVRRRKGNRRRPRIGLGRVEGLHTPHHQHHQLRPRSPPRPSRQRPSCRSSPPS